MADADQFSDGLLLGFTQFFTGLLTILGTIAFMLITNLKIGLVVVMVTPASLFVARFVANHTHKFFTEQTETRGEQTAFTEEAIGGLKTVQAFAHEDENAEKFDEINARLEKATMNATFYSSLTNPSTRFINNLVYALVALLGAFDVIAGRFTVGGLTKFLSYANQYTKPFNEISGVITELKSAFVCAARIFTLIDESPEPLDAKDAVVLTDVKGDVELSHVRFGYVEGKTILHDLSLKAKPGNLIAIVGPTGAGKTTIINLLMRFYDVNSGEIRIDGQESRGITRDSLRNAYTMVLQETWLFHGTIYENITYGKENATMEEVIAAAKAAKVHSFIEALPEGYHTVLSDDGINISKGQKQLITIARAMLSDSAMLILDEATSNVDSRTEMQIQEAMYALMKGRTCFVIAHRLSTIRNADTILVVKDGNVIEQGNHDTLMAQNGFYRSLYNSQFD